MIFQENLDPYDQKVVCVCECFFFLETITEGDQVTLLDPYLTNNDFSWHKKV